MPSFSQQSKSKLALAHPDLQKLFNEVIKYYDCTILESYRGQQEQDQAVAQGRSKLPFPQSKHNTNPSLAVDVSPCPIDWNNIVRFHYFAGFVFGIASKLWISNLRWGGDWKRTMDSGHNSFNDLVHFELIS